MWCCWISPGHSPVANLPRGSVPEMGRSAFAEITYRGSTRPICAARKIGPLSRRAERLQRPHILGLFAAQDVALAIGEQHAKIGRSR